MISYVKKDSDTAPEVKAKDSTEQTVTFTRKATVNLVTKKSNLYRLGKSK